MVLWKCPKCGKAYYSAWERPVQKTVECPDCRTDVGNPYYRGQRVKKLEDVADAAKNVFQTYFNRCLYFSSRDKRNSFSCYDFAAGYCRDCEEKMNNAWDKLEEALTALAGEREKGNPS